ncbi:mothers against decapentaplegic homolog 6 isoform X2 [Anthonomus grandis grandis]|uniref:mothers against decapentaplegic homolog 6 isoform X2 n=1 Tax=Anthonomus grandis grandis TaxID=2921223 RepID=UPI002165B741|nr:mothers against decapentaplegic homolog 6 isoform X2 [Anthonomus grandis grandis]
MFIFRRRRGTLTKKLVGLANKRRPSSTNHNNNNNGPTTTNMDRGGTNRDNNRQSLREFLRTLQDNQLEMLLTAVENRGTELGHCVLVKREHWHEPHVLCCQSWRWPEVRCADELRRLPQCGAACDLVYACCNPFHWSRLCQPDRAPSEVPLLTRTSFESLTTSGDSQMRNRQEWCKLAYWELQERVGPLFPVEPNHLDVFGEVPCGPDGVCLDTLGLQNEKQTDASRKTRAKIGLGITLSREADGHVWLYNRSKEPVFVDSVYLEGAAGCESMGRSPVRVPPDHCVCAHAPESLQTFGWDRLVPGRTPHLVGPAADPNSIRVSFVKGWGKGYSRTEITSCPCWLEILLAPCR